MKIIPIFAPNLYSILYDRSESLVWDVMMSNYFEESEIGEIDELERLIELWNSPLYLTEFFHQNQHFLNSEYWKGYTIATAAKETRKKANSFMNELEEKTESLNSFFRPVSDSDTKILPLGKSKSKYFWLRLYAIKIDENRYIITGGAIKLTQTNQEAEHTNREMVKLNKVLAYLKSEGVFEGDSFDEVFYDITL